ncbi:MAG: penicillin-binding protein 1C [Bacteroidales bacterium]
MSFLLGISRKRRLLLALLLIFIFGSLFFLLLPKPAFHDPVCTVLLSEDGALMAATIAEDEQYRFPQNHAIPYRFEKCITTFEDQYFYRHPGINPFSIARAAWNNIKARRIVQGGSTISMQTVRLSRKGRARNFYEKFVEAFLTLRLEISNNKKEILSLYASNAPFGGNVVGLDAAAWRYYGRSPNDLSWAESAALAVLPNAPSLVHPGRNPDQLRRKRNILLKKLYSTGIIDSLTWKLSLSEPLPAEPKQLPRIAPHLLTRIISEGKQGQIITSTIDPYLQERAIDILNRHNKRLSGNLIRNAAILILDIETNETKVYIGNTPGELFGNHVDIITAPRSTGSILKPFLYASMLHDGQILPRTLVPDIPTQIGGYTPRNFHPEYDGAVPASRAIARSLNIPAVRLLQQYGVENFRFKLNQLGLTTVTRSADDYGLSLILGGAEATLWDLAGVYAGMARTLNNYAKYDSRYDLRNYHAPRYETHTEKISSVILSDHGVLDAAAIYYTFKAMKEVARPDELSGWQYFTSSRSIAWKTGTSFGHRDAWAIGLNPDYVVAVWVGNASGEGRPNLTGISAAAPILFDVFGLLPPSVWFEKPFDDMQSVAICRQSGHRASPFCNETDSILIPVKGLETIACPYHQLVHLNPERTQRVTDQCVSIDKIITQSWFVLPPAMEWFYKKKNPFYKELPAYMPGCNPVNESNPMALLYPRISEAQIVIPRDLDGKSTETIFEAAHREDDVTIYWHLNNEYLGHTQYFHKMALQPGKGHHLLTLVDEEGNFLEVGFNIVNR